jgi:hypothetical protein
LSRPVVPRLRAARLTRLGRAATAAAALLLSVAASAANLGVKLPALPLAAPSAPVAPALPASLPALPAQLAPRAELGAPSAPSVPGYTPAAPAPRAPAPAAVGAAIAESKSVDEAFARVVKTGALSPEKVPQDPTDRLYALKRLWDHAAPAYAEGKIAVDSGWAVPALRVENAGTTYLVHPVAHGQLYPPNRRAVLRLVGQIKESGGALYSEEKLPSHYGFAFGRETMDHRVDQGLPIAVEPAAGGVSDGAMRFVYRAFTAAALTPLALALPQIIDHPSKLVIVPALLYLAFLAVLRSGLLPFYRFEKWGLSRQARALGAPEMAEQLRREAGALHRARLDALEVLRLHLPPGPGAEHDAFAARSEAMAKAVAEDAKAAEAKVVHLLVGYKHAADIGWRLRSQRP